MNKFTQIIIAIMGLLVVTAIVAMADPQPTPVATHSSGNQLMQGYVSWYEKPASTVGSSDTTAKNDLVLQAGSVLYLEGNSTLHKYQMHANTLLGSASLKKTHKGDLAKALKSNGVDSMELVVPVNTLKSKESGLDDNAYKALKTKENPTIKFILESETIKDNVMTAKGNLTIAGATVPITLSAETEIKGDQIRLKGVHKLKMSDYKVTPPSISLLVTSITCTDEIEIHYNVIFAAGESKK